MSATPSRSSATPKPSRRSGATGIIPGLYLGGWSDALEFAGTRVCVRDEAPSELPNVTHIPIYDATGDRAIVENLDRVARFIEGARARGETVLVFCGHGIRRAPLAVAWYLQRAEHLSLDDAYAQIRRFRPRVEGAQDWIGDTSNLRARE